jgi:hypothetical protein
MLGNCRSQAAPAVISRAIRPAASPMPLAMPPDHVGPVALPTGRMVWWTGRVAIGLRHQPEARRDALSQSASWIQSLMLGQGA